MKRLVSEILSGGILFGTEGREVSAVILRIKQLYVTADYSQGLRADYRQYNHDKLRYWRININRVVMNYL